MNQDKSISKTYSIKSSLWERCKAKAGPISLSKIIRQLLTMWLNGQIEIDWENKGGQDGIKN